MSYWINTGNTSLAGIPHPALRKKLKDVCLTDCYLNDCRKHRTGCECFKPRDLIIHHCCPMEFAPCITCNTIHLPDRRKKVIKKCKTPVIKSNKPKPQCKVIYKCNKSRKF